MVPRVTGTEGRSGGLERASRLGEAVLTFDGLTNNGGFLDSFHSYPDSLEEVADGFDLFGLPELASFIRMGISLLPPGAAPQERRAAVDDLSEGDGERLEDLGTKYLRLAPADLDERVAAYWVAHPTEAPADVPMGELPHEIAALLSDYVYTSARREEIGLDRVAARNALFTRNHALYKRLRTFDAGRAGIAALMGDSRTGVRLTAAVHSLAWQPREALAILREIALAHGLDALEAQQVLKQYEAGTLNLDW